MLSRRPGFAGQARQAIGEEASKPRSVVIWIGVTGFGEGLGAGLGRRLGEGLAFRPGEGLTWVVAEGVGVGGGTS